MIEVPCPLCSSRRWVKRWEATDWLARGGSAPVFSLVECVACHMVYVNPRPEEGELDHLYPPGFWWAPTDVSDGAVLKGLRRLEDFYRKTVIRDHLYTLSRALGPQLKMGRRIRLLDVGCGSGSFIAACAGQGIEVAGIDRSIKPLRVARLHLGLPVVGAVPDRPPFRAGSFDVVTLFNVLEHLPEPLDVLRRLRVLLKPRGLLLVQVPNLEAADFALFGTRWRSIEPPRHLLYFTPGTLRALLARAGYDVVGSRHFSLRDNPASLATSAAPNLDPIVLRTTGEGGWSLLLKQGIYFFLVVSFLPLAVLDSLRGGGGTLFMAAEAALPHPTS